MKGLRTAVVGLGRIGWQFHLPLICKHTGFKLVAVVDPLPDRLKEAQTAYDVKGYAYFALDQEPLVPVTATRELMRVLDLCRQKARSAP